MLDGWYCRTLANEQGAAQQEEIDVDNDDGSNTDDSREQVATHGSVTNSNIDYKTQYRYLKRKLKFLIYENEFFQDALRSNQRRLLKVSRDRAFLLDRLLQYEKPENTSSESDETESSEDESKKKKLEQTTTTATTTTATIITTTATPTTTGATRGRKRKIVNPLPPPPPPPAPATVTAPAPPSPATLMPAPEVPHMDKTTMDLVMPPKHIPMTAAEVERHLQSRQSISLMPERASATVPMEMFSTEPTMDSHLLGGSSPTHVAAEECVPMEYTN